MILPQNRHPHGVGDDDLSRGRLEFAAKDTQESRLARAVRADDAVAVAGGKFEVYILEEKLTAEMKTEVVDCNHVFAIPPFFVILFIVP